MRWSTKSYDSEEITASQLGHLVGDVKNTKRCGVRCKRKEIRTVRFLFFLSCSIFLDQLSSRTVQLKMRKLAATQLSVGPETETRRALSQLLRARVGQRFCPLATCSCQRTPHTSLCMNSVFGRTVAPAEFDNVIAGVTKKRSLEKIQQRSLKQIC